MRDSGLGSIAPNFAKSTSGTFGIADTGAAPVVSSFFTWAFTSSCVMRSFGPVPLILPRSAPSSRANLRTEGLAYALENADSSIAARPLGALGAAAGAAAAGEAVAGAGAGAELEAAAAGTADAGAPGCAATSSSNIKDPSETLSPALTLTSLTLTSLKPPMSGTNTLKGVATMFA